MKLNLNKKLTTTRARAGGLIVVASGNKSKE